MRAALGKLLVRSPAPSGSRCTRATGPLSRPCYRLKVPGSFIRDIGRGPREDAITRAIIGLGREVQSHILRAVGCRSAQGYLFGPPMDAASLGLGLTHWPMATR
jgi:hypothetical protein